jgi:hypothetical protein
MQIEVFENRVLRRIFGPSREEVTGTWINLHDVMRWVGHVACIRR